MRALLRKKEKYQRQIHPEIVELAKRLRSGNQSWKPNTSTELVFAQEVVAKLNSELSKMSHLASEQKKAEFEKQPRAGKDNANFRKAMSLLTLCFGNIDEVNNVFDDFVTESGFATSSEFKHVVDSFVDFFDKIESIRTSPDAKDLMRAFHL